MNRHLRAAFDVLIRLMLVAGLAYTPLAQSFAMAAMAAPPTMSAPQAEAAGGCPHHAEAPQASPDQPQPGGCCAKKGAACHCAMTVALPTSALPAAPSTGSEHPVSVPRLTASVLPSPESPPPRG